VKTWPARRYKESTVHQHPRDLPATGPDKDPVATNLPTPREEALSLHPTNNGRTPLAGPPHQVPASGDLLGPTLPANDVWEHEPSTSHPEEAVAVAWGGKRKVDAPSDEPTQECQEPLTHLPSQGVSGVPGQLTARGEVPRCWDLSPLAAGTVVLTYPYTTGLTAHHINPWTDKVASGWPPLPTYVSEAPGNPEIHPYQSTGEPIVVPTLPAKHQYQNLTSSKEEEAVSAPSTDAICTPGTDLGLPARGQPQGATSQLPVHQPETEAPADQPPTGVPSAVALLERTCPDHLEDHH
jgi:hypothetical protein